MGSRTLSSVVTPDTIALNAFIYGYAGHSLVTPHAPLQQLWWTEERIEAKVSREFLLSKLSAEEKERLDMHLCFGDGLTDDTYEEWILGKAKRLFLILVEIGLPGRIFKLIDAAWDDGDLPVSLDTIGSMGLSPNNEQANRRFYRTQFAFLLRELRQGCHIAYGSNETIPLEYVHKLPPAVSLQGWSRVHLPKSAAEPARARGADQPEKTFVRRRYSLGSSSQYAGLHAEFLSDVHVARTVKHRHVAPLFASFTAKGNAYTLTSFVGEHTLRSFIDHRSAPQYQRLSKPDRRALLLRWMHCLADGVAAMHASGVCHTAIRPSNILIDRDNDIAFSDIGSLKFLQKDKKVDKREVYTYGAPEAHTSQLSFLIDLENELMRPRSRKSSIDSKRSSEQSMSDRSSQRHVSSAGSLTLQNPPNPSLDASLNAPNGQRKPLTAEQEEAFRSGQKADVFSLACVFLDLLTFLFKRKPGDFVKHRSTKHKVSGKGSSRVDSSFHNNIDKLDSWMEMLNKLASEHDDDVFRGIPQLLRLVHAMLAKDPDRRPTARVVRDRLFNILVSYSHLKSLHCETHNYDDGIPASDTASLAESFLPSKPSPVPSENRRPLPYGLPLPRKFRSSLSLRYGPPHPAPRHPPPVPPKSPPPIQYGPLPPLPHEALQLPRRRFIPQAHYGTPPPSSHSTIRPFGWSSQCVEVP